MIFSMTLVIIILNGLKSEIKKSFYNPAQKYVPTEAPSGMNGEMDCMEKWFCEAQTEGGATLFDDGIPSRKFPNQGNVLCTNGSLYVSGIPNEWGKDFVENFLRDNIPHAADIRVPTDRLSGTIKGLAEVQLPPGVNVQDVLKQAKGLKMGSQRLKIKVSSVGGSGGDNSGSSGLRGDNFGADGFGGGRRVTFTKPLYSPFRSLSPVMFEK